MQAAEDACPPGPDTTSSKITPTPLGRSGNQIAPITTSLNLCSESLPYQLSNLPGEKRWDRVSYLYVLLGAVPDEQIVVWECL